VSLAVSPSSRRAIAYGPEFSFRRLPPSRVGIVPGRPKARVRCPPTSADTAHAPKNTIRVRTTTSTREKINGTGNRLEAIKLPPLNLLDALLAGYYPA